MIRISALFAFALLSCSTGGEAGSLHDPNLRLADLASGAESDSSVFSNYRPGGPVSWNQDWPWKLDLTGIAWDRSNTATVISPRHVVMAAHYIRKSGQELIYHDRSGRRHARRLVTVIHFKDRGFHGDVAVGLLDRPLPAGIRRYPLPAVRTDEGSALVGATSLVTEQKRSLFFHRISRINGSRIGFRFDKSLPDTRKKHLIAGDSGHPSFVLSKGELILIETHTGGGAGSGPFYGSKDVQAGIRAIAKELDPEHTFKTVSIDKLTLQDAEVGRAQVPPPAIRPKPVPAQQQPAAPQSEPRRPRPRVVLPPRRTANE